MEKDKAESDAKLKESEARRMQDKAEAEARRMQDKAETAAELAQYKAETDAKMKKIMDFMEKQQLASTPSATEAQTQESSNVRFFKH